MADTRGLKFNDAMLAGQAIAREIKAQSRDHPVTAHCGKCGAGLRAGPAMLAMIRKGVSDHAQCGGVFREGAPATPRGDPTPAGPQTR